MIKVKQKCVMLNKEVHASLFNLKVNLTYEKDRNVTYDEVIVTLLKEYEKNKK